MVRKHALSVTWVHVVNDRTGRIIDSTGKRSDLLTAEQLARYVDEAHEDAALMTSRTGVAYSVTVCAV